MSFTLAFLSIYFFLSALLAVFFAAYAISKGTTTLVKVFFSLCLLVSIYLFGYLLELNSSSLPQIMFWNQIQYIGIPFYPALWLLLSLIYTKTITTFNRNTFFIIFTVPILTFLMQLTNPMHHLYYKSLMLKTTLGLNFLTFDKEPWYLFYCIYITLYFLISISCYVKNYRKVADFERSGYKIMILASLLPFISFELILINPGNVSFNYVALILPFSFSLILIALFKYDFLALKTLARDVLFERSSDAMILIDNTSRLMDYNPAAAELFQELDSSMKGKTIEFILGDQINLLKILNTNDSSDIKISNGDSYGYFEVKTVTIKNDFGNIVGRLINLINITERKNDQEALKILASTDALTNLYNRNRFMQLANLQMECSSDYNTGFTLLMIDIDHFKHINDTNGHAAGDAVLAYLGCEMKRYFRKTDIIGRLGGEEFAVILPSTSLDAANNITEFFCDMVSKEPIICGNKPIYFTLSIGISVYDRRLKTFGEVLKLADEALYESKKNGRNRVTVKVLS
ncbi:histidine kinase N-terminal 7TM domain-containing diguanylate cyclase [Clostridium folliculivorans]|uniref:GGDEF domain-containing protein n=1 Tax=Clostridium folliculivorans TaxID=2886038 RepID=A0A9W5Y221_9CLOT|nr:diguanylate cyclase [Clostridium folliculivorans]GKU25087.1 hypothetical protein CFOLD11_19130 [Clostridium folliculivorans]GKU31185.1 hypothetical protein CFB3_32920 [Clostridium folliculivorans]